MQSPSAKQHFNVLYVQSSLQRAMIISETKIVTSGLRTSWQVDGETMETVRDSKSLQMVTAAMKLKDACSLEEKL